MIITEADIGKQFRQRDGAVITLTANDGPYKLARSNYPWASRDTSAIYTATGTDYKDPSVESGDDLVERIGEEMRALPEKFQIKVRNPEHSAAIQHRLFELGMSWLSGKKPVSNTDSLHIIVSGKNITHANRPLGSYPIITLDDTYLEKGVKTKKISGRTLTLANGCVFGGDFSESFKNIVDFIEHIRCLPSLGNFGAEVTGLQVGCQRLSQEDLEEFINWIEENKDEEPASSEVPF